jgi:hypothetical protein
MLNIPIDSRRSRPTEGCAVSVGPRQCEHLAAVVAEVASAWSVELHDDSPGAPTIIILPEDPDDPVDLALLVHGVGAAFQLDELCGESYRKLGEHLVWAEVLRAVRIRLLAVMPAPPTLH